MLAFYNVTLLNEGKGVILDDLPHVHFTITCDALVFNPETGSRLTGVLTESFHSHISLIVHKYFNASVPAHCLREIDFQYDEETEQWTRKGEASKCLEVGKEVAFTVKKVFESNGIISLEGAQPSLCYA